MAIAAYEFVQEHGRGRYPSDSLARALESRDHAMARWVQDEARRAAQIDSGVLVQRSALIDWTQQYRPHFGQALRESGMLAGIAGRDALTREMANVWTFNTQPSAASYAGGIGQTRDGDRVRLERRLAELGTEGEPSQQAQTMAEIVTGELLMEFGLAMDEVLRTTTAPLSADEVIRSGIERVENNPSLDAPTYDMSSNLAVQRLRFADMDVFRWSTAWRTAFSTAISRNPQLRALFASRPHDFDDDDLQHIERTTFDTLGLDPSARSSFERFAAPAQRMRDAVRNLVGDRSPEITSLSEAMEAVESTARSLRGHVEALNSASAPSRFVDTLRPLFPMSLGGVDVIARTTPLPVGADDSLQRHQLERTSANSMQATLMHLGVHHPQARKLARACALRFTDDFLVALHDAEHGANLASGNDARATFSHALAAVTEPAGRTHPNPALAEAVDQFAAAANAQQTWDSAWRDYAYSLPRLRDMNTTDAVVLFGAVEPWQLPPEALRDAEHRIEVLATENALDLRTEAFSPSLHRHADWP